VELVAECLECGRQFFGFPKDMRDHYGRKSKVGKRIVVCGGRVAAIKEKPAGRHLRGAESNLSAGTENVPSAISAGNR